jgi:hypothetical protein
MMVDVVIVVQKKRIMVHGFVSLSAVRRFVCSFRNTGGRPSAFMHAHYTY